MVLAPTVTWRTSGDLTFQVESVTRSDSHSRLNSYRWGFKDLDCFQPPTIPQMRTSPVGEFLVLTAQDQVHAESALMLRYSGRLVESADVKDAG